MKTSPSRLIIFLMNLDGDVFYFISLSTASLSTATEASVLLLLFCFKRNTPIIAQTIIKKVRIINNFFFPDICLLIVFIFSSFLSLLDSIYLTKFSCLFNGEFMTTLCFFCEHKKTH